MLDFRHIVQNNGRTNILTMYLAPSYKDNRALSVVIEEKWLYKEIEHIYCRAINKHDKYN